MKDSKMFKEHMALFSEIFDKEVTQSLRDLYWKVLEPFTDEQCKTAFLRIIRKNKFFPKPSELLDEIIGSANDAATRAWIMVDKAVKTIGPYRSVEFKDPAIHSAIEVMGGWVNFQNCPMDEWKWKQKEFEKIYGVVSRKKDHPKYLLGIVEQDNRIRNFPEFIPDRVLIKELQNGTVKLIELPTNSPKLRLIEDAKNDKQKNSVDRH